MVSESNGRAFANVSSIAVIQFRFMGDLVMGMALLDNLKRHYPKARLSIVSDAGNAALMALRPDVEFIPYYLRRKNNPNLFSRLRDWGSVIHTLRACRPDILIDSAGTRSSAILSAVSGAPVRIGYPPHKWVPPWSYTHLASMWGKGTHVVDRVLSPLQTLGLPVVMRDPRLEAAVAVRQRIGQRLADAGLHDGAFVAVHLGARVAGRQWPLENFAEVMDAVHERYGLHVAIVGGPDERDPAVRFSGMLRHPPVDLTGALAPEELSAVFARCRFFLGNDSGPMHIAAGSGARVVALFGMQFPERWGPLGEGHVIVRPVMPCPCIHPDLCRPPDPQATYCVRRLTVTEVLKGIDRVMCT